MKLEEYLSEFNSLENKMNLIDNPSNDESLVEEMNAERDEMGYAVSWKRALSSLYNETSWLHSYHSINNLAVQDLNNKAKSFMEQGDYNQAIERLKSSLDLDSSIFETHYNLAVAYTQNQDYVNRVDL